MKSLEQIALDAQIPAWKLQKQLKELKELRKMHRFAKNGWSYDKNAPMLSRARIPMWIFTHPDFKDTYFSGDADEHERAKNLNLFLKKFGEFKSTD